VNKYYIWKDVKENGVFPWHSACPEHSGRFSDPEVRIEGDIGEFSENVWSNDCDCDSFRTWQSALFWTLVMVED